MVAEETPNITDYTPEEIADLMEKQAKTEVGPYSWFHDGPSGIMTKCRSTNGKTVSWYSIGDDDALRRASRTSAIKNIGDNLSQYTPHSLHDYLS